MFDEGIAWMKGITSTVISGGRKVTLEERLPPAYQKVLKQAHGKGVATVSFFWGGRQPFNWEKG